MNKRPTYLALSAAGWLSFNAVVLGTIAFLANRVLPVTVDGDHRASTVPAVIVDVALLLLFAVQHSVMARRSFKARLRRHVPEALERTTYVLATNACLVLLLLLWQPFGGQVWRVHGAAAVVLWVVCGLGWALAIASTFAVDHLELSGLRQAGWAPPRAATDGLQVQGLYRVVRHPLMTGMLIAFWVTPDMGAAHLLFASVHTGYIVLGVMFEERDLRRTFGAAYDDYAARVPAVVPGWGLWRRAGTPQGPARGANEPLLR